MAKFDWGCPDCEIFWEREYPVGKAPKRTRCPECGKLSERYMGNMNINISFKDDGTGNRGNGAMDFHTVRRRYQNHSKNGFDKDSANRFLNRSIKETKERISDETGRYKQYNINYEAMARDGLVRRRSDAEAAKATETAKKLTRETVENANKRGYNLDIATGKPKKQNNE